VTRTFRTPVSVALGAGLLLSSSVAATPETPLYRYVDPRIGTGNDDQGDTVPGPTRPIIGAPDNGPPVQR